MISRPLLGITQVLLCVVLLTSLFLNKQVSFEASFSELLPASHYSDLMEEGEQHFFDQQKQRMVVTFQGIRAVNAHDALLNELTPLGWIESASLMEDLASIAELYSSAAGYYVSPQYLQALQDKEQVNQYYFGALADISNPYVPLTIGQDNTLATASFLASAFEEQGPVRSVDGRLVIPQQNDNDQPVYLMFAKLGDSDASLNELQENVARFQRALEQVSADFPSVKIVASGIPLHTVENVQRAEYEISLFGGLSLLGLVLLVAMTFRSLNPLIAVFGSIGNAIGCGLLALFLVFDSPHVLSLVFGITLIGIAIDYTFHVLCASKDQHQSPDNRLVKAIMLGFITTSAGYGLFIFAPIALLTQVAVFVVSGLLGAVIFSVCLTPSFVARRVRKNPNLERQSSGTLHRIILKQGMNQRYTILLGLLVLGAAVFYVKPVYLSDNIAHLNASSAELLAAEAENRALLAQQSTHRVLIEASSLEEALKLEYDLKSLLNTAFPEVNTTGVSDWLLPSDVQLANYQAFSDSLQEDNFAQIESLLATNIKLEDASPLSFDAIMQSPLGPLVGSRVFTKENGAVLLMDVDGVSLSSLQGITQSYSEQVQIIDKQASLSKALGAFSIQMMSWLLFAVLMIFTVIFLSHGLVSACKGTLIVTNALMIPLLLSGVIQEGLNLFNMLSTILIIALAIDYLIFYLNKGLAKDNVTAITLSAASSALVFGMLVFSSTPAVFSFGLTASLGIICIYILTPMVVKENHENRAR